MEIIHKQTNKTKLFFSRVQTNVLYIYIYIYIYIVYIIKFFEKNIS